VLEGRAGTGLVKDCIGNDSFDFPNLRTEDFREATGNFIGLPWNPDENR